MNIVIIAAGEQGKEVALILQEWLPQVIPIAKIVLVGLDLSPSTLEHRLLVKHVDPADAIVFCVTPQAAGLPDTPFFIGLVAGRKLGTPFYPFFVGVDRSAVPQVLSVSFQCVFPEKESVLSMVSDITKRSGEQAVPANILVGVFSAKWPPLEFALNRIASQASRVADRHPSEKRPLPSRNLSSEAGELLVEAARDPHGRVMSIASLQGRHVQTNQKAFVEPGNPRSEAKGLAALRELAKEGLLEPLGSKGEVYAVTADGYRVADEIRLARK